jgi:hypothetical protein
MISGISHSLHEKPITKHEWVNYILRLAYVMNIMSEPEQETLPGITEDLGFAR